MSLSVVDFGIMALNEGAFCRHCSKPFEIADARSDLAHKGAKHAVLLPNGTTSLQAVYFVCAGCGRESNFEHVVTGMLLLPSPAAVKAFPVANSNMQPETPLRFHHILARLGLVFDEKSGRVEKASQG